MPFFKAPKDYPEMLNKIACYNFLGSLIATILAVNFSEDIKKFFTLISFGLEFEKDGIKFAVSYLYPAVLIAIISRASKLHDRISDIFKIRKRFDLKFILIEISKELGYFEGEKTIKKLAEKREELMYSVFYKYASSTSPKIDTHLIIMALDNWCWYWITIELRFICILLCIMLFIFNKSNYAFFIIIAILVMTLMALPVKHGCVVNAKKEITSILEDRSRKEEIRRIYKNALRNKRGSN